MTRPNDFATAHEAWEQRWTDEQIRQYWLTPESLVVESIDVLRERRVEEVIDIGCGVGRHALYLAQQGFLVSGIDLSQSGLEIAQQTAAEAEVEIDYQVGDFIDLPFPEHSFDAALAWNVIYHGDEDVVRTALAQIYRILKPGGLFIGTMISKRHDRYGDGTEVRPNTFIVDDDDEKAHAHYYCNDQELIELLDGFQLLRLQDREQRDPAAWHWEFLAEKIAKS